MGIFHAEKSGFLLAGRCAVLLLFTELAVTGLIATELLLSERVMLRSVFVLVLAIVLLPQKAPGDPPSIKLPVLWSVLSGASLLLGLEWLSGPVDVSLALPLAGGTAVLVLLFSTLCLSLAASLGDRRTATRITLATLLLGLSLPLWASPIAALNGGSKWLVDSIVGLCPASYLASLAQIDYLRGNWLYQNTAYGGLRFDYPDAVYITLCMLLLVVGMLARDRILWSRRDRDDLMPILTEPLETKP